MHDDLHLSGGDDGARVLSLGLRRVSAVTVQTAFDRAIAFVLGFEGGLSRDPVDSAAKGSVEPSAIHTAYGITQRAYDAHRYTAGEPRQPVALIEMAEVGEVYLTDYWRRYRLDEVALYAPRFAMCLFDGFVQHPPDDNARLWQRTVQSEADGIVGPDTLMRTTSRVQITGERLVMASYLDRRRGYYAGILQRRPEQKRFRNGWRRRLNSLCREVGIEAVWPAAPGD